MTLTRITELERRVASLETMVGALTGAVVVLGIVAWRRRAH